MEFFISRVCTTELTETWSDLRCLMYLLEKVKSKLQALKEDTSYCGKGEKKKAKVSWNGQPVGSILIVKLLKSFFKKSLDGGWWLKPVIPALWKGDMDRSSDVRSSRPVWPTWRNPISTKNTKISWAWWCAPVIPATREAEAGESLECRRWRFQGAEISSLHFSLVTEQDSVSILVL